MPIRMDVVLSGGLELKDGAVTEIDDNGEEKMSILSRADESKPPLAA